MLLSQIPVLSSPHQAPTAPSLPLSTDVLEAIKKSIAEVKTDISALKAKDELAHCSARQSAAHATLQSVTAVDPSPAGDSGTDNISVENAEEIINHDRDDSVTTDGENTPELADEVSLNGHVPTNQLW